VGTWYDFPWAGSKKSGRRGIKQSGHVGSLEPERVAGVKTGRPQAAEHKVPVSIDSVPIFARGGAVIPTQPVVQHTNESSPGELTLELFAGDGSGSYYNDDGISHAHCGGAFVEEQYEQRLH